MTPRQTCITAGYLHQRHTREDHPINDIFLSDYNPSSSLSSDFKRIWPKRVCITQKDARSEGEVGFGFFQCGSNPWPVCTNEGQQKIRPGRLLLAPAKSQRSGTPFMSCHMKMCVCDWTRGWAEFRFREANP